ncbi:transmembrane 9 superfamily member 1 [Oncorhynchus tshawytscha]|uniref:transmembrane 9 superfamily member 1 n=1 Tax=Oncorhynchus tshawytscha TaxID=74940 RepID=UPI001C3CCA33|nr:transmembrane 9 superfamily member 1 [Oncorhynchus tshawytscha]
MSPCIKSNSGRIQRKTRHCQLSLTEKEVDQLREAIEELRYFEFVLDDIPIWGFVGYMEESGFLPQSHKEGGAVDTPGLQHHVQRRLCDLCQRLSEGLQASAPGGG